MGNTNRLLGKNRLKILQPSLLVAEHLKIVVAVRKLPERDSDSEDEERNTDGPVGDEARDDRRDKCPDGCDYEKLLGIAHRFARAYYPAQTRSTDETAGPISICPVVAAKRYGQLHDVQ